MNIRPITPSDLTFSGNGIEVAFTPEEFESVEFKNGDTYINHETQEEVVVLSCRKVDNECILHVMSMDVVVEKQNLEYTGIPSSVFLNNFHKAVG